MYYVILDPTQDYAIQMVSFLARFDMEAIAVFTSPHQHRAFHVFYRSLIGEHVKDEYLVMEFDSIEALAEQILEDADGEIQGIIPWEEYSIELGAQLGELLELDWNALEIIHRFRNKFEMKKVLREAEDVRINASEVVASPEKALEFAQALESWPIVVKPMEGAGSIGVSFTEDEESLVDAVEELLESQEEVLLEEYISGQEYVVNGITDAVGQLLVTDVWRYDKRDVGPIKNVYHQTLKVSSYEPEFMTLALYATQVIHTLELRRAPVHMELKLDEDGPCLVEVGARFGGGNHPALASLLHNRSLFELAACHYLDEGVVTWDDVNYEAYDSRHARIVSGVQTFLIPHVTQVLGATEVTELESFYGYGKLLPLGARAEITRDVSTRSYEVYLVHEDPEVIEADARRVRELLRYV